MKREKNFTYTITYIDTVDGKVATENACVNKARGYGQSWFATEEAARKRVQNQLNWFRNSQRFDVVGWTLSDRNSIIEKGC
jgi:photosystem II stability/assembly factor-like uncharacterized protein